MGRRKAPDLSGMWSAVQLLVEAALKQELTKRGWVLTSLRPLEARKDTTANPWNIFQEAIDEAPFTTNGLSVLASSPDELLERVLWVEKRASELWKARPCN